MFETIYAKDQRRYVESLSSYARQFLERMNKADVDFRKDISPAVAIEEKVRWKYSVEIDGSKLARGVYFYRIKAGNNIETKKLVLLK